MKVTNLSTTPFDIIMDCFFEAFEGYFVKMPNDKAYFRKRWESAKVDYNLSYGIEDEGKLVGFIIHAIDTRDGKLTAFNTGTGVIPSHRGKRIVKTIYDYAFMDLKKHGVERSTLEVITENKAAIKSYESVGFNICKTYRCFSGSINNNNNSFELQEASLDSIDWNNLPNQQFYSWDNQKETILNGNYSFFRVIYDNTSESYFIINPDNGYIAQLDLLQTNSDLAWNRLFSGINQISDTVKINNVDDRLRSKLEGLKRAGLENSIDQYEMELELQ